MAVRIPEISTIDFLINRKYPLYSVFTKRLNTLGNTISDPSNIENLEAKIETYRQELLKKPKNEIENLWAKEKIKIESVQREKEQKEEQARFFNQPGAEADFDYWSKMAHCTLDESVALSFGKNPVVVNWNALKFLTAKSAFAGKYAQVRELVKRAKIWKH